MDDLTEDEIMELLKTFDEDETEEQVEGIDTIE